MRITRVGPTPSWLTPRHVSLYRPSSQSVPGVQPPTLGAGLLHGVNVAVEAGNGSHDSKRTRPGRPQHPLE